MYLYIDIYIYMFFILYIYRHVSMYISISVSSTTHYQVKMPLGSSFLLFEMGECTIVTKIIIITIMM